MKIIVHPADFGACGAYRMQWPAEALAAQGHDVTVDRDRTYTCVWRDTIQGPTIQHLNETVDADIVVFQRPLSRNRYELIGALQAQGVTVVVEIDDDFHAIHPRNPAYQHSHPLRDPDHNRDWLMRACRQANLVTVTTPALAERYGHGHCQIIPNYVPERYLTVCGEPLAGTVVGWSGSTATHPDDLQAGRGVAQAVRETGAQFHVIGTGVGVVEKLALDAEPSATGWVPLDEYPAALASLDVGIVPLAATTFNEAKSALKGLEMAAVGVPFVASSTGPYRELARAGIGHIATDAGQWRHNVSRLVTDHVYREHLSLEWQTRIKESWTLEANAWRWAEAWASA